MRPVQLPNLESAANRTEQKRRVAEHKSSRHLTERPLSSFPIYERHRGRAELRTPETRLVGSVGYSPEKYGQDLIALALKTLDKKPVPSAVFAYHRLITPENVDHSYPDAIIR